jgi:predicted RNase H-like HicB family nuclease
MVNEVIFQIEESPEGGYEARALGFSIFTDGETYEEIKTNILDAVNCHFDEDNKPKLLRLHFIKDEIIAV